MNSSNTLIELLYDLKQNHHILGLKAEFEDEGASFEEVAELKKLTQEVNLNLTVKISGCGALNDINQVKTLVINSIVAPMIESPYALKKFIQTIKSVYTDFMPTLFINIETINGYRNFDEIISTPEINELAGIVVGRFDMAKSMGLECKDTNGERIFSIVNNLAVKTEKLNKQFIVGGGVKASSLEFFRNLNYVTSFETRKVIFDADYTLENNDLDGILKAIKFELLWLENKSSHNKLLPHNLRRLDILKTRYEEFLTAKI